eukprot:TRINITY_DN13590_c0_g3_i1.p1 TRINITY_DN13590_c0_g3~~TRINITY_DN13590_c0_g3_i1.p1  ORF type:complete len:635 (-),score=99.10 TRINITY_DN13590_c0_g3_i1:72-1916(-)
MVSVVNVIATVVLLCMSGLFSGLNLGLMSLDQVGLELTIRSGTKSEKKWAKAILPLRRTGNLLLCSLLLGNTAVNAMLAIFMGDMAGGLIGGLVSTMGIVVFGEIIPQSICSRYGLAVGYYTRHIVYFFMLVTFLLAFPVAKILDCILGAEVSQVFSATQFRHLLILNSEDGGHGGTLSTSQAKLLAGALKMEEKRVRQAMVPFSDIPHVHESTPVDPNLVFNLYNCVYPCIPVVRVVEVDKTPGRKHELVGKSSQKVVNFVNVKDLVLHGGINAGTTVGDIVSWYDTKQVLYLGADEGMHCAYQKFTLAHRHLAVVVEDYEPIGFISQRDLQRGWAVTHTRQDDDAARFGFGTDKLNRVVRMVASKWKYRAQQSAKLKEQPLPGQPNETNTGSQSLRPDAISARCSLPFLRNDHVVRNTLDGPQALVHRRTLFLVYTHLVQHTKAFKPEYISSAAAAVLLALPRLFSIVPAGTEIAGQGDVEACIIVFRGEATRGTGADANISSVMGASGDNGTSPLRDAARVVDGVAADGCVKIPVGGTEPTKQVVEASSVFMDSKQVQVFDADALLPDEVTEVPGVRERIMAISACFVLRIHRDDYVAYRTTTSATETECE